ncbi:MAG: hypothetical protein JW958_04700 [Candidatus Eisenbacteria bacterium]|nr:hypothetical protein [Candidatus Eisenbacteria bacterium]
MPSKTTRCFATGRWSWGGSGHVRSLPLGGFRDDALEASVRNLRRSLDCRANVLITGDVAAARGFFRARLSSSLREIGWRDLNREGPAILFSSRADPEETVFLDRIERLDSWVRAALLDLLEAENHGGQGVVPRLISGCYRESVRSLGEACLERALFYRLGAITVHVPFRKREILRRFFEDEDRALVAPGAIRG